jgi:hypothetical protein
MSRTTVAQLNRLAESVSELLPSNVKVACEAYSGRKHVNLYRLREGRWMQGTTMRAGTAGAMYEWLLAMREALFLSREGGEV